MKHIFLICIISLFFSCSHKPSEEITPELTNPIAEFLADKCFFMLIQGDVLGIPSEWYTYRSDSTGTLASIYSASPERYEKEFTWSMDQEIIVRTYDHKNIERDSVIHWNKGNNTLEIKNLQKQGYTWRGIEVKANYEIPADSVWQYLH